MTKNYSRKSFLKLGLLAGLGLLFRSGKSSAQAEVEVVPAANNAAQTAGSLDLVGSGDPRYEDLRKGFNKRINRYPKAIALCTSTSDVVEAIQYAKTNQLAIAVKSGGHSMEGFSANDGGLVINLSKLNGVEFLPGNKIKVGPGCTLSQLYDNILPKKRIIPVGSCGTVGVGGLTLGGGYGLFARKYGLACDNLLEATLVDGNGLVHSTKDNPELLWALRGGGAGNFGVVTELVYQSHSAPDTMQAHRFKARNLDSIRAKRILKAWFTFSAQLPDSCFAAYVLNGGTLTVLVTNFESHTPKLQGLLNGFAVEMDEFKSGEAKHLAKILKNYYGSLVPVFFKNSSAGLYKSFADIELFVEEVLAKVIATPGLMYQVNTLGGNINNPDFEKVSCYPHRSYNYISELQAYWDRPAQEEKLKLMSQAVLKIFFDRGINSQYINYCSLEFPDWQTAYYGKNYSRLQAVKKKYDADNLIRHPQSIKV